MLRPRLDVVEPDRGRHDFKLDPRIETPETFRVAFVILLDGDLVMSPEHLGVAMMTAVLRRAGFTVTIHEVAHGREDVVCAELVAWQPHVLCFTLMSLNTESCLKFCERAHSALPDVTIVCGGPAGTYASEAILEHNPFVGIVAIGEGEPTIFELVQRLYLRLPVDDCPGICYRHSDGRLARNPTRALIHNLDDLPYAARDQLVAHDNELEYVRISTSRGCVARCTFCSAPNVGNRVQSGKAWRGRSTESILDELSGLVATHQFRTFDFVDSTFEDPDGGPIGKRRIARIAEGILERDLDIYFNCCMRAENWTDDDHPLLDLLVRSGLEKVNVGIEAGTEEELRLWDKLATVEDNVRIIRLLREHDIYLAMGFIQFHPYSTVDTVLRNAAFLRDHAGHNLRRLTERLEIYPGTRLAEQLASDGLLDEDFQHTLHPYAYQFRDERVAALSRHFASLYNNSDYHERGILTDESSVFRFETFNVVVSTYLSRSCRRFRAVPGALDVLAEFRSDVHRMRQAMARFNYQFFMQNVEDVMADRLDRRAHTEQLLAVDAYFGDRIAEIKSSQLKCSRALSRLGCDLYAISSKVPSGPRALRTYTGGGTACW